MFFWHLGITAVVVFATLGRRRIDYRVVLVGSILPDLIDKPVGRLFFEDVFQNSRLFGHTLLFSVVLLFGIQLTLRGATARRWFILPIACMIHLGLDAMWNDPVTLFWPLFGSNFPVVPVGNYWLEVLLRPFSHPAELLKELVGLASLSYLAVAFGMFNKEALKTFLKTGELPAARVTSDQNKPG